jgi:hypothetical protein
MQSTRREKSLSLLCQKYYKNIFISKFLRKPEKYYFSKVFVVLSDQSGPKREDSDLFGPNGPVTR